MTLFEAGFGPRQMLRVGQWLLGIPIVWSFGAALLTPLLVKWWPGTELPDPMLAAVMAMFGFASPWYGYLVLALVAVFIELSDKAIVKATDAHEALIHEIIKGIGDRLRAGAAVETAVAEACRSTEGPSEVFERAIELSDTLPFELALREAADTCGSEYLKEVCYLVAEAVSSEGDIGGAIRRLGMELERNHQYGVSITAKIANPVMVLRGVGLFAVPPLYALLRASFNGFTGSGAANLEPGATLFFTYGAIGITVYDGLIFGQWDRLFARLPLALGAVYMGLTWIS